MKISRDVLVAIVLYVSYARASYLPCYSWFSVGSKYSCVQLNKGYNLYYRVESDGNITFGLEVAQDPHAPLDWVGLGISEAGGMRASDIMLLRHTRSGGWMVQDRWSEDFATPVLDDVQDVHLRGVVFAAGVLRALVSRPLDSCDAQDIRIELGVPTNVIWAVGTGHGAGSFRRHADSNRGNAVITFAGVSPAPPSPTAAGGGSISSTASPAGRRALRHAGSAAEDSQTPHSVSETGGEQVLEYYMPSYNITQEDDQYVCVDLLLPADRTRHITAFEGVLRGSPQNVHHMVVFACLAQPSTFGRGAYRCEGMPVNCVSLVMHWVPGKGRDRFPQEAGYAVGPAAGGGLEYIVLQLHYNNVARLQDRTDRSGVRLYVTDTLRPYDMGTILLGSVDFKIPPAQPSYALPPSVCPTECTSKWSELNVWATALHMHLLGKSARLRHVRNGTELRPLASMQAYDFNYQSVQAAAPDTARILPGDVLVTECTYDSSRRDTNTSIKWGEGSQNEMCFAVIMYWPRIPQHDACLTLGSRTLFPNMATCGRISTLFNTVTNTTTSSMAAAVAKLLVNGDIVAAKPLQPFAPFNTTGQQCLARRHGGHPVA